MLPQYLELIENNTIFLSPLSIWLRNRNRNYSVLYFFRNFSLRKACLHPIAARHESPPRGQCPSSVYRSTEGAFSSVLCQPVWIVRTQMNNFIENTFRTRFSAELISLLFFRNFLRPTGYLTSVNITGCFAIMNYSWAIRKRRG